MLDLWYKNAVIYSLDVETYQDSDGDGIGDFNGLTERLDHIASLGITCIWLLPFYPSPNRDNGYDITDYYGVDPRLGTLGDFVEFAHQVRERGMRLIVDLVVNHTSDQHPWFQSARADPNSRYRDFYLWSEEKPANADQGIVFPGHQKSTWTWDDKAGAFYMHRFYEHQPDLNTANPLVREEICKIMGFWLELGVSGFRIDAAPFLLPTDGGQWKESGDPYKLLREFRDFLSWRQGDAMMLGEANVPMEEIHAYFGDGTRMHMLFNFMVNQHLFLALTRQQAEPLIRGLKALPPIPNMSQWAQFVRNHDELDLGRLSDAERQEVFAAFAPDESMLLYDRGIRRRLPPMLDDNRRRIEMTYSLMFSLPGTPVLRYGEEIGMGEDLSLPEREAVRTPMQWSADDSGGFSTAPPDKLIVPVIRDGTFGTGERNVVAQQRDKHSLLNWVERLIRTRRGCPEIGWGTWELVATGHDSVFAHACTWHSRTVLMVHNLGDGDCGVTLDLDGREDCSLTDLLEDQEYEPVDGPNRPIQLGPYGYRWFRLDRKP
jgi:maltose alpha-D-glucosyltransferase/alpha-amylase